jgi:hypothetical protein
MKLIGFALWIESKFYHEILSCSILECGTRLKTHCFLRAICSVLPTQTLLKLNYKPFSRSHIKDIIDGLEPLVQ